MRRRGRFLTVRCLEDREGVLGMKAADVSVSEVPYPESEQELGRLDPAIDERLEADLAARLRDLENWVAEKEQLQIRHQEQRQNLLQQRVHQHGEGALGQPSSRTCQGRRLAGGYGVEGTESHCRDFPRSFQYFSPWNSVIYLIFLCQYLTYIRVCNLGILNGRDRVQKPLTHVIIGGLSHA